MRFVYFYPLFKPHQNLFLLMLINVQYLANTSIKKISLQLEALHDAQFTVCVFNMNYLALQHLKLERSLYG